MRQPSIDQLSPTLDDPDPLLIAKAEKHLDGKVRTAAALFEEPEDVLAGLDPEQVGREHGHRDLIERSDRDLGRAEALHPVERACSWCRLAYRPKPHDPGDRKGGQPNGECAERRRRSTIHPVCVVDADQEGRLERLAFEERLELSEQPEPLFRLSSSAGKLAPIDQRFRPFEQCRQESSELHDALARLGGGGADPEPEAAGDVGDLGE